MVLDKGKKMITHKLVNFGLISAVMVFADDAAYDACEGRTEVKNGDGELLSWASFFGPLERNQVMQSVFLTCAAEMEKCVAAQAEYEKTL